MPIICYHGSPGVPEEFSGLTKYFPNNQLISFARMGYPNDTHFQDIPAAGDIIVLGYSWGNVPALHYAVNNKSMVKGIIMVSPYLYPDKSFLKKYFLALPGVGDIIFLFFGKKIIQILLKKTSYPCSTPIAYQKLAEKLSSPGVLKSAIREKNDVAITDSLLKDLATSKIPVGILLGAEDVTINEDEQITSLYKYNQPLVFKRLQNAGHAIIFTHQKELADFISNFMLKIKTVRK